MKLGPLRTLEVQDTVSRGRVGTVNYLECSIALFLTKINDDAVASGLKILNFPDLVVKSGWVFFLNQI